MLGSEPFVEVLRTRDNYDAEMGLGYSNVCDNPEGAFGTIIALLQRGEIDHW